MRAATVPHPMFGERIHQARTTKFIKRGGLSKPRTARRGVGELGRAGGRIAQGLRCASSA